jgi:hypothetical protein
VESIKDLMIKHPTTYHLILSRAHGFINKMNCDPRDFWGYLTQAYNTFSMGDRAMLGDCDCNENTHLIGAMTDYMRFITLKENRGELILMKQVQALLTSGVFGADVYSGHNGKNINQFIMHSCLPNSKYAGLSIPECGIFFNQFYQNLREYSPERCAFILIEFAKLCIAQKNLNMILLIASSKASDVLKNLNL